MDVFPTHFPVHALSEAFVGNIRRFGRNWELWLGIRYYLHGAARDAPLPATAAIRPRRC